MGEIHPHERLTADLGRQGVCLRHQCIYILQIWELKSVLLRESSAWGGRRRETLRLNSQQAVQISHAQNALCHMNGARDFWSLQSCRFSHGARRVTQQMAVRDMLIVQCALQLLPKARSLTTYFSMFQFQMTLSGLLCYCFAQNIAKVSICIHTNNDKRKKGQRLFTPSEGRLVFGQSVTSNKKHLVYSKSK